MNHQIIAQINELDTFIEKAAVTQLAVSKASVGWHIEHTLAVIVSTAKLLAAADPLTYSPTFSVAKWIILTTATIPRGKAKAPASVCPTTVANQATLTKYIENAKISYTSLQHLPANLYFNHPYFGHLNIKAYSKFLLVHNKHHLKIIKDLLKH